MTFVTLLYSLALAVYSALAVRILTKRPRTALNWTAALVLASLAVWSVEDIVHGIPTAPFGLARLFEGIGSFGWGTFASLILVFALVLTGRRRVLKSWPIYIPLAGLPALIIYAQLTGRFNATYVLGRYGWTTVWPTSWPTYLYYAYYIGFALVSLFLFWQFRRRAQLWRERRQATLMLGTASAAMGLALADYVIRQLTHVPIPDLAGVLVVIWAAGLYFAVTRHGMMSVTPQAAADDILATMPDALLLLTPEGQIVLANQAARDLLEYPEAELVGKPAALLFTSPGLYEAALQQVRLEGELKHIELTCRTRLGKEIPASISARLMSQGRSAGAGIVWVLQDISSRQEHEAALRRAYSKLEQMVRERTAELTRANQSLRTSEERFRELVENQGEGIGVSDPDEVFTFANPAAEQLLGVARGALVGRSLFEFLDDEQSAVVRSQIDRRRTGGRSSYEVTVQRPDGMRRVVLVTAVPRQDAGGRWTGTFTVLHDITERKRTEAELVEHRDHLEELVHARTGELELANKELETFSYSVSHDLRAPLRAINGFAQALREDCADQLNTTGHDYLDRVSTASRRMAELIDDLLALGRIARQPVERKPVNLSELARTIAGELREAEPARQVELVIPDGMTAQADPALAAILLRNLLGNAWKFTGKHATARIEVGETVRDGEPVWFVRDDGAGFDMTEVGSLFTPFKRLHKAADFAGTGIGLATVQRIVLRHGGRGWIEGAVEKGTTFYFTFATATREA